MLKRYLILLILLPHALCNGQYSSDSLVTKFLSNLQVLWENNNQFHTATDTTSHRLLHTLLTYPVESSNQLDIYTTNLNNLKADLYHRDIGLNANAGYLENLNPGPDEDNLIYQRRLQAGLTWDILKNGLVSNRKKEQVIRNENIIDHYQYSSDAKRRDYMSRWHSIIYMFNQIKSDILISRHNVVQEQLRYAEKFHQVKLVKREDLLAIQARLAEIEAMERIYESYNQQLQPDFQMIVSYADYIPVFDIDYSLLLSDLRDITADTVRKLQEDNVSLMSSYAHDISLKANIRYNWYDLISTTIGNRQFISVGLTASIPIPFNHNLKTEIARVSNDLEKFKGYDELSDVQKDLMNDAYEYRYKMKQFIGFYEKRIKYLELLRQENVLLKLDPLDFNPIKALGLIDDILSIDLELIELKQNLYLKILRIYTKLPAVKPKDLIKPVRLPQMEKRELQINRGYYVWSQSFKELSIDFIVEYLKYNETDKIIASANQDSSSFASIRQIKRELPKKDVYAMIGRNKLIHEGNILGYLDKVIHDPELIDGVHLDIEPHTLEDYQGNREKYLRKLVELTEQARKFCDQNRIKLEISIPLHYDSTFVRELYAICDGITFMAYENVKLSYLTRKLLPYSTSYPLKTSIALRSEDFKDRIELENLIDQLRDNLKVDKYVLHDLSSMFKLDQNTINPPRNEEH